MISQFSRFSSNSEANASELLENFEDIFLATDSWVWMMNKCMYRICQQSQPSLKAMVNLA